MRNERLLRQAKRAAQESGLNWDIIDHSAKQIIVYGSRAMSVHKRTSDIDLLCIGQGRRYKSKKIHIIWISEAHTKRKRWIGSELATHISAYGKWIKGTNTWAFSSRPNAYALELIRRRVLERAVALREQWPYLLAVYRRKHVLRLRRDLQRYVMMCSGRPPVPAGSLDRQWLQRGSTKGWSDLLQKVPWVAPQIHPVIALHGPRSRRAVGK